MNELENRLDTLAQQVNGLGTKAKAIVERMDSGNEKTLTKAQGFMDKAAELEKEMRGLGSETTERTRLTNEIKHYRKMAQDLIESTYK